MVPSAISSNYQLNLRAITAARAALVALETCSGKHRVFAWGAVYPVCIIGDFLNNFSKFLFSNSER